MAARNLEAEKMKFIEHSFQGECYVASKILINIYPTLFGSKPATLVRLCNLREKKLLDLWEQYKTDFATPDLEIYELKRTANSVTILFYRKELLSNVLYQPKNLRFLTSFGYSPDMSFEQMLLNLKMRFTGSCPHEIGLFLGIPLKDVLGYLGLISLPCNLCGHWKVYGRADKAKALFETFRQTKERLMDLIVSGESPSDILKYPNRYALTVLTDLPVVKEAI